MINDKNAYEKKKGLGMKDRCKLVSLIPSWWSSFRITFSAVYWSGAVRLERNFAFLAALSANCLMHFSSCHFLFQLLYYFSAKDRFCTTSVFHITVLNLFVQIHINIDFDMPSGNDTSFSVLECQMLNISAQLISRQMPIIG
jgi:hypothetical protein